MEKEFRIDVRNVRIARDRRIVVMEGVGDGAVVIMACKTISAHRDGGVLVDDNFLLKGTDGEGNLEVDSVNQTALLFMDRGHFDIVYDYIGFIESEEVVDDDEIKNV